MLEAHFPMLNNDAPNHTRVAQIRPILQGFGAELLKNNQQDNAAIFTNALIKTLQALLPISQQMAHPAEGQTLERWQILAQVAATDLTLVKWFESHLDALSILHELKAEHVLKGLTNTSKPGSHTHEPLPRLPGLGAVWAADGGPQPVQVIDNRCSGVKMWCSGVHIVQYGLMSYRNADGQACLCVVDMQQPGIHIDESHWQALGMRYTQTASVTFNDVPVVPVGCANAYLDRPGFWQGAAGVAACWFGAAAQLGQFLIQSQQHKPHHFKAAYLGEISTQLAVTREYFYHVARCIDERPTLSHEFEIRMLRAQTEQTARLVIDRVGQALGAAPFCQNARFARLASDLTVFIRQSHAAFDWQHIGEQAVSHNLKNTGNTAQMSALWAL